METNETRRSLFKLMWMDEGQPSQPLVRRWYNQWYISTATFLVLLSAASGWFGVHSWRAANASAQQVTIPLFSSLGFSNLKKKLASPFIPRDSVTIRIVSQSNYKNHYRFPDTLTLFTDIPQRQWSLEHDTETDAYLLHANGKVYELERGFDKILPLTAK